MGIGQFCVVWYFFLLFISLASLISLSLFCHSCRIFVNRWVFCFKLQLVWKFLSVSYVDEWIETIYIDVANDVGNTAKTFRLRFIFVGWTIIFENSSKIHPVRLIVSFVRVIKRWVVKSTLFLFVGKKCAVVCHVAVTESPEKVWNLFSIPNRNPTNHEKR